MKYKMITEKKKICCQQIYCYEKYFIACCEVYHNDAECKNNQSIYITGVISIKKWI